jgi:hypothetical protein
VSIIAETSYERNVRGSDAAYPMITDPLSWQQLSPMPCFPHGRGLGAVLLIPVLPSPFRVPDMDARQPARLQINGVATTKQEVPPEQQRARATEPLCRTPLIPEERAQPPDSQGSNEAEELYRDNEITTNTDQIPGQSVWVSEG